MTQNNAARIIIKVNKLPRCEDFSGLGSLCSHQMQGCPLSSVVMGTTEVNIQNILLLRMIRR